MTRPLDASDKRPGPDGLPDERTKGIDVIGSAESIIFPALEELFRIRQTTVPFDVRDWEAAEAQIKTEFRERLRDRIVRPLWGTLPRADAPPHAARERMVISRKETEGSEEILRGSTDLLLEDSVVIGEKGIMAMATRPDIRGSLLAGEHVLLGFNTNTTMFNGEQLRLLAEVGAALREGDQEKINTLLALLDPLISNYDRMEHEAKGVEKHEYREQFGALADAASVVDARYMDMLKGMESTNVQIDNSLILGRTAKMLGGQISNSIIVSDGEILLGAHVRLKNTDLVSVDVGHNISVLHVDGRQGSPDFAEAAVEAVKDLPPSPLLNM
jgi:hypothetical protein